jgi:hypothetical protein
MECIWKKEEIHTIFWMETFLVRDYDGGTFICAFSLVAYNFHGLKITTVTDKITNQSQSCQKSLVLGQYLCL